ncbi:hypothetical protein DFJ74DRAFT_692366 [Hyaloraphidium curvatum]|nr:hypothetical protein DFJ74DRAFT_692366 [Hyaloraphidium curvatum]
MTRSFLPAFVASAAVASLFAFVPPGGVSVAGHFFTRAQVGVSLAGVFVVHMAGALVQVLDKFGTSLVTASPRKTGDYSSQPVAVLARWRDLVEREPDGALARHADGDAECPCPLPSCVGRACAEAAATYWIESTVKSCLIFLAYSVLTALTAYVTFGLVFWTTGWSAVIGAMALLFWIWGPPSFIFGIFANSAPVLRVSKRLQHRAMGLALDDLVARLVGQVQSSCLCAEGRTCAGSIGDAVHAAGLEPTQPMSSAPDMHAELHDRLARVWRARAVSVSYSLTRLAIHLTGIIAAGIILSVGGSCLPLFVPIVLLYLLAQLLPNLINLAVANSQIDLIVDLYVAARARIHRALTTRRRGACPFALEELAAHDAQLAFFAGTAERHRARVAGVAVGPGMARGVLAAVFTIAVGLWSVLRSAGIAIVVDSVCPTYPSAA